jgi:hypothetical protein
VDFVRLGVGLYRFIVVENGLKIVGFGGRDNLLDRKILCFSQ